MRNVGLGAGIALFAVIGAVVFLWPVQRVGPEPIRYGHENCAQCRMQITQQGFAGEMRDKDGVLTKYDDIGCLLRALMRTRAEVPEAWVEDHNDGGLVPLLMAHLVQTDKVWTPMGYGIVAFRGPAAARTYADSSSGAVVALEELLRNPARFVPAEHRDAKTNEHSG